VGLCVAICLALPGTWAHAEPSRARPAAAEGEPLDIGELWQQAQARMDTSDYDEAIVLLTRVYDAVARDPEAAALRLRVQWALHRAHVGAHAVDRDPEHLYVARDLLRKYREALPESEAERGAEAQAALDEIDDQLARIEASRPSPPVEPVAEPEMQPEPEPEPEPTPSPPLDDRPGSTRPLIIGGAVAMGLSAAGLATMAAGLGIANAAIGRFETQPEQRADARQDIKRGNTLAVAGGVAGGVLLLGGALVLGFGLRQRARSRSSLVAGPGQVGAAWRVRF